MTKTAWAALVAALTLTTASPAYACTDAEEVSAPTTVEVIPVGVCERHRIIFRAAKTGDPVEVRVEVNGDPIWYLPMSATDVQTVALPLAPELDRQVVRVYVNDTRVDRHLGCKARR